MRQFVFPLFFIPAGVPSFDNASIIRRHDIPDSAYVALGKRYSSLAHINLPTPQGATDGEGTLIAPRWILSAAHGGTVRLGHRITVGRGAIQRRLNRAASTVA